MKENTHLAGRFVLELLDAATGKPVWRQELKNQLTTLNQTTRAQLLLGTLTDASQLKIKYFGFGTSGTAAKATDTALNAEVYRKQVTQISQTSSDIVQSVCSLGAGEGNFNIREIGVFCGSATAEAGTGTLLSRVVTNIEKNSNLILNIIRQDICTI
nr:MAG TPA: tail-collar fiber protein [Caudoviricetes sp.]